MFRLAQDEHPVRGIVTPVFAGSCVDAHRPAGVVREIPAEMPIRETAVERAPDTYGGGILVHGTSARPARGSDDEEAAGIQQRRGR